MKLRSRECFKGRRDKGTFFLIPTAVLDSPAFCSLSFKARALLLDLGSQFRGHNNGDLAMPWSLMKQRGWVSKQTLQNARDELLAKGLIEQTRQGGLHAAGLYAITWQAIDECHGKLDVAATRVPSNKWRHYVPVVITKSTPTVGARAGTGASSPRKE